MVKKNTFGCSILYSVLHIGSSCAGIYRYIADEIVLITDEISDLATEEVNGPVKYL